MSMYRYNTSYKRIGGVLCECC